MRFLYGIKNCHSCAKREACNLKDSPKTLIPEPKVFEHVNRAIKRHVMRPTKIETFCKLYSPEEPLEEEEK